MCKWLWLDVAEIETKIVSLIEIQFSTQECIVIDLRILFDKRTNYYIDLIWSNIEQHDSMTEGAALAAFTCLYWVWIRIWIWVWAMMIYSGSKWWRWLMLSFSKNTFFRVFWDRVSSKCGYDEWPGITAHIRIIRPYTSTIAQITIDYSTSIQMYDAHVYTPSDLIWFLLFGSKRSIFKRDLWW